MYKGKEVVGIIPARGGSKGIPRKNIIDLGGYPLIAWTIIRARNSKFIDRLILSSEDDEIIQIAKEFGCEVPFKRPKNLATDEASSVAVTLHALKKLNYNSSDKYFLLLQPTSPFRRTDTIDEMIKFTIDNEFPYVMSVSNIEKSPYHIYLKNENYLLKPLFNEETKTTRRQDLPQAVVSNGVLYMAQSTFFNQVKTYKPKKIYYFKTSKLESIDIDGKKHLDHARSLIDENKVDLIF